jgi:hypothetical protein
MSDIIAKPVVKNKFWIVEEGGEKIATIQAIEEGGFAYVHDEQRELFPSIQMITKKYKVEFVDRDGLVDHMNCMLPSECSRNKESNFKRELAEFFIKKLGDDSPGKLRNIINKLNAMEDLDIVAHNNM